MRGRKSVGDVVTPMKEEDLIKPVIVRIPAQYIEDVFTRLLVYGLPVVKFGHLIDHTMSD